jgi:tetratricopeptide (TPR) repeat protein
MAPPRSEYASLIEAMDRAIALDPRDAALYLDRAVLHEMADQLDEALRDLGQAMRLNPGHAAAYYNRANVRSRLGDLAGAVEDLGAALERDPKLVAAHFNRAVLEARRGAWDAALDDFGRALELDATLAPAYARLAAIAGARGDFATAIEVLRAGQRNVPGDRDLALSLAWQLATAPQAGLRDGALALKLARELDRAAAGGDPAVLDVLAAALAETGAFAEALEVAKRCLAAEAVQAAPGFAAEVAARIELYRRGEAFRQSPP